MRLTKILFKAQAKNHLCQFELAWEFQNSTCRKVQDLLFRLVVQTQTFSSSVSAKQDLKEEVLTNGKNSEIRLAHFAIYFQKSSKEFLQSRMRDFKL